MCNCGAKHKAQDQAMSFATQMVVEKINVWCPECTSALVGANGMTYPVDKTVVLVSRAQFNQWLSEGHPVVEYEDQPAFA